MEDATELHLRPRSGGQAEDETVLIHLRTAKVGVDLRVGERGDRRCVVEGELDLARDLNQPTDRRREQLAGGQFSALITANRLQEARRSPVFDPFVSTRQGADDLFASPGERDIGEAALFRHVQLGRRQLLLQEIVRQGQAFASPARGKPALDQMRDDHEPELETLGLVHGHQVDGIHRLV